MPAAPTTQGARARRDFDRLARIAPECWTPTDRYLPFLSSLVPDAPQRVLDVGCGTGVFARVLAARASRVTGLDISPETLKIARERSREHPNIDYACADASSWDWPEDAFDCITCLTTLHHLPLEPTIERMKRALHPGGTLLVHDILHRSPAVPSDLPALAFGGTCGFVLKRLHEPNGPKREALRRFWREHGCGESYLTARDLHRLRATLLPGAHIRCHLLFRYTLTWSRPTVS